MTPLEVAAVRIADLDDQHFAGSGPLIEACRALSVIVYASGLTEPPPEPPPMSGFHLYRLWSADRRLLYVGVSLRLSARLAVHRRRWGDLIAFITWEAFSDAPSMLSAESAAIRDEDPALNVAGIW